MTNGKLTDRKIAVILARAEICDDSVLTDYADIVAAMRELQERRKSFRWIPIDEELPEDESTVIVKNIDGVQWVADFSDACFYPDEFPVYKMGGDEITHWMRFPE